MKNTLKMAALIALISLSAHVAQATTTVIYNSTGAAQFGSEAISSSASGPLADEFLTGNAPSILSQTLILFYVPANASTSGTISVGLYSNANGPATLLSTLGTVPNNSTTLDYTYVTDMFDSSYQLAANTEYWIELSSSDTQWNWVYALNSTGVGVAGQDVYHQGDVDNTPGSVFVMELSTTDVTSASPEPGTLALCGFSFLCLAACFRLRK
jgi:hypothetical protein